MQIEDLKIILKVAEYRSITAAATSLDMSTATASAAIKRVEKNLGIDLFVRTTRQLRLSSAGERYIPHCQQALQMLDTAQQNVKEDLDIIDGELRIGVSSDLGRNIILPWLDELMQTHTGIQLKVHITDSNVDFYRDPIDLALRYGSPNDAGLYGFKICNVPRVVCASKNYLSKHGTPKHPSDLINHNVLFYQLNDIIHNVWQFSDDQTSFKVKLEGDRAANDGDLVRRWCIANKGIAIKSSLDMSTNLLNNDVVQLLPRFQPQATELWLICPSKQSITPTVRLVRDMLKNKCALLYRKLENKGVVLA